MKKYLAFDIEISKQIPEGASDLLAFRPLGISCAATLTSEGQLTLWHGKSARDGIADQMAADEARDLVQYLQKASDEGQTIVTWNGLSFDFDVLAEESGLLTECRDLALRHVDMMFHFFCVKGFPVGLDKVAKGMGLRGKPPGMTGILAPKMWADGQRREVLEYVAQDVRTTMEVALAVEKQRVVHWITAKGSPSRQPLSNWLTVAEAVNLPPPDTTWMSNPMSRSKFIGWTTLKR